MRSDEHRAEAERLIAVARTTEGKKQLGKYGDPSDPVAVTVLAGVHAQLAAVPDEVIDAEVVDEEAEELVDEARTLAGELNVGTVNMSSSEAAGLLQRLANALEERAGTGSGVQINADAFDADPNVVEVPVSALRDLVDRVVGAEPGRYANVLDEVLVTLRGWQR